MTPAALLVEGLHKIPRLTICSRSRWPKSKSHAYDNTFISCSPEVDVSCSRLDSKKTITPGSSRNGKERDSSVEHFEKLADQGNAKAALGLLYTTIHGIGFLERHGSGRLPLSIII